MTHTKKLSLTTFYGIVGIAEEELVWGKSSLEEAHVWKSALFLYHICNDTY